MGTKTSPFDYHESTRAYRAMNHKARIGYMIARAQYGNIPHICTDLTFNRTMQNCAHTLCAHIRYRSLLCLHFGVAAQIELVATAPCAL